MNSTLSRQLVPDALKALALLAVFLCNGLGYWSSPTHVFPLGPPSPADSVLAMGWHAILMTVVMGKGWPLLAFLFGHSLQLTFVRLRRGTSIVGLRSALSAIRQALSSRYKKLLCIGLLHGLLVYYGDILTAYAITGLIALRWAHASARKLKRIILLWLVIAGLVQIALAFFLFLPGDTALRPFDPGFGVITERGAWWATTVSAYLAMQAGYVLMIPKMMGLMLLGVWCAKLRLLTPHSRVSRRFWRSPIWASMLGLGFVLQLGVTLTSERLMAAYPNQDLAGLWQCLLLSEVAALLLLAGGLSALMRWLNASEGALPAALIWLSPAGRFTLPMYLGLSIVLAVSAPAWAGGGLTRAGLHPLAYTLTGSALLVAVWWMSVKLCHLAVARGWRDPLGLWLGQSTRGLKGLKAAL